MCNYGTAFVVIAILLAFLIFLQVNAVWSEMVFPYLRRA